MLARETMREVINTCNVVHVATLDAKGVPCVRTLAFAGSKEENTVYFMTRKVTRKVEQIRRSPKVGFAIDREFQGLEEVASSKYIKGTAIAGIVEDPVEQQKAMELLMTKIPFLAELPHDSADFVVIRLTLEKVLVSNNNISFGHTEEISF